MSTPDSVLVAWWLLTVALIVSWFLLVQRQRALNRQAAVFIALKGGWTGHHAPPMPAMALPHTIGVAAVILIFAWLAGFIAFILIGYWTRLLLLNLQLLMVLFGAGCLSVGLSSSMSAIAAGYPTLLPRAAVRPLMTVFGLAVIAAGSYSVVGDLVPPRLIIEGQVNSVSHSWSKGDKYSIVIDGKRYETLRDVFLTVSEGDRVRAEAGAASKTILRVEPTRAQ